MENELDKTGIIRDKQGKFVEGVSGNPAGGGRPKETPEQKAKKKAMKEMIKDYKEKLAEALESISPVLIAEALKGNIQAIKEVNDRVMGKAEQKADITSRGEKIIPIYNGLSKHDSDKKDIQPKEEDKSSIGGNISQ